MAKETPEKSAEVWRTSGFQRRARRQRAVADLQSKRRKALKEIGRKAIGRKAKPDSDKLETDGSVCALCGQRLPVGSTPTGGSVSGTDKQP